jgi:hypothetical protein
MPPEEASLRPNPSPAVIALSLCLASAAPAAASAQAPAKPAAQAEPAVRNAMVIEGDDHLFMVAAPAGWVLDDTSGMGSRIRCVFYPKGQTWANAPTVMYVNPMHGNAIQERTVSAMIAENEKEFRKRAPKGRVLTAGTLTTASSKSATVKHFSYDGGPVTEAVAYVPESELVMLLVLSSRDAKGFQAGLPAFKDLVSTYAWVGSNKEFGR